MITVDDIEKFESMSEEQLWQKINEMADANKLISLVLSYEHCEPDQLDRQDYCNWSRNKLLSLMVIYLAISMTDAKQRILELETLRPEKHHIYGDY